MPRFLVVNYFIAHDFFQPQPVKDAAVFLLRFITHNWADPFTKEILTHLRNAANSDTKLLTIDFIVPYTCSALIADEIQGASQPKVPEPLLPNLGEVSNMSYWSDLQVCAVYPIPVVITANQSFGDRCMCYVTVKREHLDILWTFWLHAVGRLCMSTAFPDRHLHSVFLYLLKRRLPF